MDREGVFAVLRGIELERIREDAHAQIIHNIRMYRIFLPMMEPLAIIEELISEQG